MGEFFRGWRRKIGVVTLVMALLFMGGWVRSLSIQDVLSFHSGRHTSEHLSSVKCVLVLQRGEIDDAEYMMTFPKWTANEFDSETKWFDETGMVWRWQLYGFGFGELPNDLIEGVQEKYFFIPHWSIVLPLILNSAYLLLSKPPKSTQEKIAEPKAIEGA